LRYNFSDFLDPPLDPLNKILPRSALFLIVLISHHNFWDEGTIKEILQYLNLKELLIKLETRHELLTRVGLVQLEFLQVVQEARGQVEVYEMGALVGRTVLEDGL